MKTFEVRVLSVAVAIYLGQSTATNFLNHGQLLAGFEDPSWYEQNIPFLEVPDQQIQGVYYYRCQTYKEHLVYTSAQYGYLASEFLQPVSYGAPYGGVVAAAGHHIIEGRWLRDQRYGKDIVKYWLAGPGQFSKPQTEQVNPDTSDWAHEYSFWAATAVWRQYLVTGDRDFAVGQLDNLVKQYRGWDNHFNADLGLYWQVPVWDATECTAASYESSDPYHGGDGYRPTINAYQYGDARAISSLAGLAGQTALASEYSGRADALQSAIQAHLWDSGRQFFMHRARDNNPSGQLLTSREIMGYVPWMFNMPQASNIVAFAQLKDPQGFAATYGPTTAERRSKWFMNQSANCLQWDGPSWPYATSQTLTAVENVLHDYPAQSYISATDYFTLLLGYVATQHKGGKPYVAEAHDPDADRWMYDTANHSEDYNHSTFIDNIIAGLLGLRGQADNTLKVNPLVPSSWDYFALENVAYHGHTVTVIWDRTGQRYGQGTGLRVFVDGNLAGNRDTLGLLTVNVGSPVSQAINTQVNIAANSQRFSQGTTAFASYTSPVDNTWNAIDGIIFRNAVPQNSRWTSYNSLNAQDYLGVDLRRPQAVSNVRLYFYDDGGGVRLPSRYDLQYLAGSTWTTVPGQQRSTAASTSNTLTQITFPTITTSQLRVVAPNAGGGTGWGLSEFEVWTAAIFQLRNENSGKFMGVENESKANSANIQQYDDNGTRDHLWEFIKTTGGWYKIRNLNSGLLLAVEGASKSNSAHLQQYQDNGTDDHLWRVTSNSAGLFLIQNKNSGLVAGVDGMSTANSANVVQFQDNGTKDHLWSLLAAVPSS
ncbi:carbohydrate-binding module family 13 protein [Coniochaeta ligniaria NRRL 30616]|uniref:Carbohydrate-binding module family 13 protein n=1 Tax=Coniochaeta ligniaria NRRL 30616 TaxID=1408157 RepID=A0A1J7IC87_9PEZI|nr:carbohydrate-binding module family 13 protein [Coniochaeta ligniaria NRRL 30616]